MARATSTKAFRALSTWAPVDYEKKANGMNPEQRRALAEALDSGQIQPEDKVLLVSFGAGLTWAAALVQMAPVTETVVVVERPKAVNEMVMAFLRPCYRLKIMGRVVDCKQKEKAYD